MIDPSTLTLQELKELDYSKLTEEELVIMKNFSTNCYSFEQAIKLALNSVYGAFGNQFFHWFNLDVAETITLQGQDAIKNIMEMTEKYFKEFFHKDKSLHKKLGIDENLAVNRCQRPVVAYGDTDSMYISFGEPLTNSHFSGSEREFVLLLNEHRLAAYYENVSDEYAKKFNTKSYLNFELETIAKNAIMVSKKKYVQDIVWKDGKEFNSLSYIKTTGLELVQSSTPPFCREKLKELVTLIFSKGKLNPEDSVDIVKKIKEIKDLFKLSNPERISLSFSISDYHKFILNDTDALEVASGCPMHVRAAGYHNYLIKKNGLKSKYDLIRSGDKIKFHNTKDAKCDVFGFKTGSYPIEIAPPIDFDALFAKTIIDPINRVISAAGIPAINYNLSYYKNSLF